MCYVKNNMNAASINSSKECAKIKDELFQCVGVIRVEMSGNNGTIWVRTARRRGRIAPVKWGNSLDFRGLWRT